MGLTASPAAAAVEGAGCAATAGPANGIIVMLTTESYLLSAPLAESTMEEMPAVKSRSTATLAATVQNVVWGRDCGGGNCVRVIWGASDGRGGIWGTASDDENIVWSTSDDENIVWSTGDDENIVWSTSDDDSNIVWSTSALDQIVWGAPAIDDRRRSVRPGR